MILLYLCYTKRGSGGVEIILGNCMRVFIHTPHVFRQYIFTIVSPNQKKQLNSFVIPMSLYHDEAREMIE
jgi:hypothetical protein